MLIEQLPSRRRRGPRQGRPCSAGSDPGFTLVELLIAVVLVGILAAVAVVGVGRLADKASAATCEQSADASRVATSSYYASHASYPSSFADLTARTGGADGALVLPAGVTAQERSLVGASWALTMVAGSPPTYRCGPPAATATAPAVTTTTAAAAPATTVAPSNGVTAVASTAGDLRYYGEHVLVLTNPSPLSAMTVTISVAETPGLSSYQQYTTFWSGAVSGSSSAAGGVVVYTFSLNPGQTVVAGSWKLTAQWNNTGVVHPTAGDRWSVVTTSLGRTSTVSGTF